MASDTRQTSFADPVEKIRRVLRLLEERDFDLVRLNLSGGVDSFVTAEAIRRLGAEFGISLDVVAHYNTGTNIPSTTALVQQYCADHGLAYVEGITPNPTERVGPQTLDYGYFGAGEGRAFRDRKHATAYVLRKQRVEEKLYSGFSGQMLVLSGAYPGESDQRGRKMDDAVNFGETGDRKPRRTMASPLFALTSGEVEILADRWDVPRAPAYGLTDSSGDCTGCAYDQAGRFANLWQEAPHLAFCHAVLMVWTQARRARGELNLPPERVFYGWGSLDADTVAALRAEDPYYNPDAPIGPTSADVAATTDDLERDDTADQEPQQVDQTLKSAVCAECDDRCRPAFPVEVTDHGDAETRRVGVVRMQDDGLQLAQTSHGTVRKLGGVTDGE